MDGPWFTPTNHHFFASCKSCWSSELGDKTFDLIRSAIRKSINNGLKNRNKWKKSGRDCNEGRSNHRSFNIRSAKSGIGSEAFLAFCSQLGNKAPELFLNPIQNYVSFSKCTGVDSSWLVVCMHQIPKTRVISLSIFEDWSLSIVQNCKSSSISYCTGWHQCQYLNLNEGLTFGHMLNVRLTTFNLPRISGQWSALTRQNLHRGPNTEQQCTKEQSEQNTNFCSKHFYWRKYCLICKERSSSP